MDENRTSSNRSLLLVTGAMVCVFAFVVVTGWLWLSSNNSEEKTDDEQESRVVQEEDDDSGENTDGEIAGVSDTDVVNGDEIAESTDGSEADTSDSSDTTDGGSSYVPVRPPIVTPVIFPDPSVAEFQGTYIPVHQRDLLSHSEDAIVFEPAEAKNDGRDLSVHLDYVPPTNPYLNKTVMGFAPYWNLSSTYQEFQLERLSVIAYFSVAVYPDGNFVTTCNNGYCGDKYGWDGWNSVELADLISRAHAKGVKVVLTVKNFDKASIENLVTSPTAQATLNSNIVAELNAKNVDGVNIDYEYIGTASLGLRAAFAASMDSIADAVHAARPGSHVSTDILGSSGLSQLIYDVTALGQTSLDAIMVMSYDFHSTSYYAGKIAAPTSPLYGDQYWYTVSEAMRDIIARAPAGKVIMGVPYYGLEFPVSGASWSSKNGSVVSSGAITTYENVMDPVFDAWHNESSIQWDEGEKMTWYRYRWPNAATGPDYWQGYYEDSRSLQAKYDFVQRNGIGGIGIWALGYDSGHTELWDVIRDVFSREPVVVLFRAGVSDVQQQAIHSAFGAEIVRQLSEGRGVIVRPTTMMSQDLINLYNSRSEVTRSDFLPYRSLHDIDKFEGLEL